MAEESAFKLRHRTGPLSAGNATHVPNYVGCNRVHRPGVGKAVFHGSEFSRTARSGASASALLEHVSSRRNPRPLCWGGSSEEYGAARTLGVLVAAESISRNGSPMAALYVELFGFPALHR